MADRITRRLFAGHSTVILEVAQEDLPIPAELVPQFVGAIDGSTITVSQEASGEYLFTVTHRWLREPMLRVLWWDHDGAMRYLMNEQFFLLPAKQRKGYGIRSVALELYTAQACGVASVSCEAAGGPGRERVGYYTWPLFGFDADLTEADIAALPADMAHCRSLNQLMLCPGGADHWRRNGHGVYVIFDLAPDSGCWDILNAYMEREGVEL